MVSFLETVATIFCFMVGLGCGWLAWYALIDRDGKPLTKKRTVIGSVAAVAFMFAAIWVWNDLPDEVDECWWDERFYVCQ